MGCIDFDLHFIGIEFDTQLLHSAVLLVIYKHAGNVQMDRSNYILRLRFSHK